MSTTVLEREQAESAVKSGPTTIAVPADVRLKVDADAFAALCAANGDLRLELGPDGGLVVMSPASGESGRRNLALGARLWNWNEAAKLGAAFDSSTGFTFPDGSVLAPDASWIQRERWDRVPIDDRNRFPSIVPDFIVELRSPSDSIKELRDKMARYTAQGVRLGWLIDPDARTVEIHRPGREVERLSSPKTLGGEDVLPGFALDLKGVLFD